MKAILKSLTVFCMVAGVQTVQAQTESQIDKFLQNCLSHTEGQTPGGCAGCLKASREKWEVEISEEYHTILSVSSDRERLLFKSMHNGWLKYKESRFRFLEDMYGEKPGKWMVVLEEEKMKIVKQYAQEMKEVLHSVRVAHLHPSLN